MIAPHSVVQKLHFRLHLPYLDETELKYHILLTSDLKTLTSGELKPCILSYIQTFVEEKTLYKSCLMALCQKDFREIPNKFRFIYMPEV